MTLVALDRFSEAEELLRTVVLGLRDTLGYEHPDSQTALADLERLRELNKPIS